MSQEREQNNPRGLTRREFLRRAGAVALGTAAGLILPDALKNKAQADAPVGEVQYKHKVFIPRVLKDISGQKLEEAERPLWPDRFGDIEVDRVEFINLGTKAGVVIGDETLYSNLFWRRDNYAQFPSVKRRIVFFDDMKAMHTYRDLEQLGPHNPNKVQRILYPDPPFWTGLVGWQRVSEDLIYFLVFLPVVQPGQRYQEQELNRAASLLVTQVGSYILFSDLEGRVVPDRYGDSGIRRGSQKAKDYEDHPIIIPPRISSIDELQSLALKIISKQ